MTAPLAEGDTFGAMVRGAAVAFGDDIAVRLSGDDFADEVITFAELEAQSALLARGLIACGVGKGSRIGFLWGNGPMFAVLLAALGRIGAVAIPLSTLLKADELVRVLRQADLHGLVVQRRLLGHDNFARLCAALPELGASGPDLRLERAPYLRWIVSSGEGLPVAIHDLAWLTDAAASVSPALLAALEAEVHAEDQLLEIYTSGSMAAPKGVRHLHGPVLERARWLAAMTGRVRGDAVLVSLPMFWVGGLGLQLLAGWVAGGTALCREGTATDARFAMGAVLDDDALAVMARNRTLWALGMSETFGPYSYGDELRAEGYPLCAPLDHIAEGYEVRVADAADRTLGPGLVGEIQVRGNAVTPGLHKQNRADHFTADGFLKTGDLGVIELRGGCQRIHFNGRAGDMIKTKGSNVSPAEVEQELQALAEVEAAFVFGLPDAALGQRVVAAVVPASGALPDPTALQAALKARLSSYKVPRDFVSISRAEIPMLPSNKVARRDLAALVAARLG